MTWLWLENESYAGQTPRKLRAACHDGSAFVTIRCGCTFESHIHESQLGVLSRFDGMLMVCLGCRDVLQFNAGELQGFFADLRRRGWIA